MIISPLSDDDREGLALAYANSLRGLREHVEQAQRDVDDEASYSVAAAGMSVAFETEWDPGYTAAVAALALVELVRLGYPDATTYREGYR